MSANAILTVTKEGETVKSCPIDGEVVLGRAEGCTIRLDDRAISRQHAVFKYTGDQVQVEKKSEFAPLSVNGIECTRAVLKEGDLVVMGPYQIRISSGKPPPSTNAPPPPAETAPISASPSGQAQVAGSELPSLETGNSPELENGIATGEGGLEAIPTGGELALGSGDPMAGLDPLPTGDAPLDNNPDGMQAANGGGIDTDPSATADPIQQEQPSLEPIDEDGKTKLTPAAKLSVKLIFKTGTANYTEYELTKDEISIGRGKTCDIILNDKKSSRKNSIIRRAGLNFMIKDLDSANGTFVNGTKVKEQELASEDKVIVGGVEFIFKALSADYAANEKDFMSLPPEPEIEEFAPEIPADPAVAPMDPNAGSVPMAPDAGGAALPTTGASGVNDISGLGGIPGITGVPGSVGKKKSLMERFRALPKRTQALIVAVAIPALYYLNQDEEIPIIKKSAPKKAAVATAPTGERGPLTFDRLSQEQKDFVKTQYDLAFNYFKNHDYDRSLYEVNKIFDLIPDYENAREIKRYAEEGKQRMQAIEDERKKKEEEAKLKAKIAQLVEDTRKRMEKKEYEQAKEMFTQILSIDPDNSSVPPWRKEIEESEEQIKIQAQQKQVQVEINRQAAAFFEEGMDLKRKKEYYPGIDTFQKVIDVGSTDTKLIASAKKMIEQIHATIRHARDPVLREAKSLEDSGDFPKAFALFKKATHIDPPHPAGYAGMNRIKGILHDRAKTIYTEAVLAESYSDFETAKKMFQECVNVAPSDDLYHERAARKLAHYFRKSEAPPQ